MLNLEFVRYKIIFLLMAIATMIDCRQVKECNQMADTVILGTIYTAEQENPTVEAFAVKDGKFIYVGDRSGVESIIKDSVTKVLDYSGKGIVIPGCTDGHAHYFISQTLSNMKGGVVFDYEDDTATIIKKMKEAAIMTVRDGKQSLFGFGWDYEEIMAEQPTLAQIDAATPEVSAVFLDATGHHVLCNSECLRRSGIIADDGKLLIEEIDGGLLELDKNGYPTGYINERASGYVMRMGGIDPDEIVDLELAQTVISETQELLLSTGYVTCLEGWSNLFHPSLYYKAAKQLDAEGELKIMLPMTYEVEPWQKDMSDQIDYLVSLNRQFGTNHVRPEYLKIFMDGCVEQKTGAVSVPYKDGTVYKDFWSVDRLANITRECNLKGITLHTHVMGDIAISDATDAYIKGGDGVHRNCLVHLRNPRKEEFKRFADNNIACTAGMTWHVGDPDEDAILLSFIDEEFVNHSYPIKSFFDAGIKVSSHTDYPANYTSPQDPFGIMEVAVTGQLVNPDDSRGPVFEKEELVTREQAFQALTINGAWQIGLENERGSIKVGKWADFVFADQNVFECPVNDIHKTKVIATWFEGKIVYCDEQYPVK